MRQSSDPNENTSVCASCGNPLDYEGKFCGFCGGALQDIANYVSGMYDWKENTLGQCPLCSALIPVDRNYCIMCGNRLHNNRTQPEHAVISKDAAKKQQQFNEDNGDIMGICQYCFELLDEGASFCGHCGSYIFPKEENKPFHRKWQDEALDICPYCSKSIPIKRQYCIFCGGALHLSKKQENEMRAKRARHITCTIDYNIDGLSEQEKEWFFSCQDRIGILSNHILSEHGHTVKYEFSVAYDEPKELFSIGMLTRMIRLFLEDAAKEFPNLKAIAYCNYDPTYISKSKNNPFDDLGGFVVIELSEGIVTVEDTPYM